MSSKNRIADLLRVSLEDGDSTARPVDAGNTDGGETVIPAEALDNDTVEAELPAVDEASTEINQHVETVDEAIDVQQGLEQIALALESAMADGGLSPQAARFMNIGVESLCQRAGIDTSVVASLESYEGGATARATATKISLEGIKEWAERMWQAVIALYERVKTAIVNFFKRLFNAAEGLRQRAEAVKKAAGTITGEAKEKEIALGSTAGKIAVGTKFDGKIDGAMEAVVQAVEDATTFDAEVSQAIKADFDAISHAASNGGKVELKSVAAPKGYSEKEGNGLSTKTLPGNVRFVLTYRAPSGMFAKAGFLFEKKSVDAEQVKDQKVATLGKSEIEAAADKALELVKLVGEARKRSEENLKGAKTLKNLKFKDGMPADEQDSLKGAMKAFQQRATSQDQATSKVTAWGISTATALLSVAQKSLAQYGVKGPAVEAPKQLEAPKKDAA